MYNDRLNRKNDACDMSRAVINGRLYVHCCVYKSGVAIRSFYVLRIDMTCSCLGIHNSDKNQRLSQVQATPVPSDYRVVVR